jgi:hypothetical protein
MWWKILFPRLNPQLSYICTYITKKCFLLVCLFDNDVKAIERISMGLRPYDGKSFVDGHRLLFIFFIFGFHVPFSILFVIIFHPCIFLPIKAKYTMETYVVLFWTKLLHYSFSFFITYKNKQKTRQKGNQWCQINI